MKSYFAKFDSVNSFLQIIVYEQMSYKNYLDIIKYFLSLNIEHSNKLYILLYVRKPQTTINIPDIKKLIKPFYEAIRKFKNVRFVELVNFPMETAYGMILKAQTSHLTNLQFEIFCTYEAAISWLRIKNTMSLNHSITEHKTVV